MAEGSLDLNSLLGAVINMETLAKAGKIAFLTVLGLVILRIIQAVAKRIARRRMQEKGGILLLKGIRYLGYTLIAINALSMAGVDLSALLGAAGIAGIAIGFAAQTSVSNVISGLFLLSEKSFVVGDIVEIGDVTGTVESIDMLSVKLVTFDNRLIRIPNETMIKTNIVNVTRFPIRRLNVALTVPHEADLEEVKTVLIEVALANQHCLDNPAPLFLVGDFEPNGVSILLGLWFSKDDFVDLKNSIMTEIQARFAREGIEIARQTLRLIK